MYAFTKGVAEVFVVSLQLLVLRFQCDVITFILCKIAGLFLLHWQLFMRLNLSRQRLIFCKESHNWHFGFMCEIFLPF